jgi:hypothetical protein
MLFPGSRQLRQVALVGALALVGCGGGHSSGPGYGVFAWRIFDIEDTQFTSALLCSQAGAGSVDVTLFDRTGAAVPNSTVTALCTDGYVSTPEVPAGPYTLQFDLYGDQTVYGNDSTLLDSYYNNTETYPIGPGMSDYRSRVYAPLQVRSFVVGYTIYYQSVLSTCAAVGASYVDLDFTVTGSTAVVTSRLPCQYVVGASYGQGASFPIPFDATSAQWSLYLVDAAGKDIQSIAGTTVSVSGQADVRLGTQTFSL